MRKDSIVKDYKSLSVPGTFVMKEKTNFLCGKMMDVEDEIRITYDFTYNEIIAASALDQDSLLSFSYNGIKQNSILSLNEDKTQSNAESNSNTTWIFEFDSNALLREYLYNEIYTLNTQSPFKQITQDLTPSNNLNQLCLDYIDANVLDRYRLKEFILWTSYYELKQNIVPGTGTSAVNPEIKLLYKTPLFNILAIPEANADKFKQTTSTKQYVDGKYEISYKQTKSSQFFTFLYYFDVIYEKI